MDKLMEEIAADDNKAERAKQKKKQKKLKLKLQKVADRQGCTVTELERQK